MSDPFRKIIAAVEKRPMVIHSMSAQILMTCGCGSPTPIVVHFIPGTDISGRCPVCETIFTLNRLMFDRSAPKGQLKIEIGHTKPAIIKPGMLVPTN